MLTREIRPRRYESLRRNALSFPGGSRGPRSSVSNWRSLRESWVVTEPDACVTRPTGVVGAMQIIADVELAAGIFTLGIASASLLRSYAQALLWAGKFVALKYGN